MMSYPRRPSPGHVFAGPLTRPRDCGPVRSATAPLTPVIFSHFKRACGWLRAKPFQGPKHNLFQAFCPRLPPPPCLMIIDTNCILYAKMHEDPPPPICAKVDVNGGVGQVWGSSPRKMLNLVFFLTIFEVKH